VESREFAASKIIILMRKTILSFIACLSFGLLMSQTVQISPQVFAAAGGAYDGPQFELSYTIGELSAVSTISNAGTTLTQGFHQTDKFTVIILVESLDDILGAELYPNPANEQASLKITSAFSAKLLIDIYDAGGKKTQETQNINHVPGAQQYLFDTSGLAAGSYMVRIYTADGNISKTLRMNKIYF
jgi:hypothetical protein